MHIWVLKIRDFDAEEMILGKQLDTNIFSTTKKAKQRIFAISAPLYIIQQSAQAQWDR